MHNFFVFIFMIFISTTQSFAFDVKLLNNNKEAFSRELSTRDTAAANSWSSTHRLGLNLKFNVIKALQKTFNEMEQVDTNCELGLADKFTRDAHDFGLIDQDSEALTLVHYLRQQDIIDDILYKIMRDSIKVKYAFIDAENYQVIRLRNSLNRQNAGIDLKKFYSPIQTWPDDINTCTLDTYWQMSNQLTFQNSFDRYTQLTKLNYNAYSSGVIDRKTYGKLQILRDYDVLGWQVYFKRYADVINNAKDKMTKTPELKATHNFAAEYASRKERITKRSMLYINYNSTQIMMLSQVLEKTAKRMEAKSSSIHWQYTDDVNGETEVYIFSPMEQYRLAIKMLKKDMAEIMRSDAFRNSGFEYEHLIAAAYETGLIKSAELDHVLKFEDFWNPKVSRWKTYSNFAFQVAGTGVVYLPPPFNIIGAIGLVLAQSLIIKPDQTPDPDNNGNVII